MYLQVFVGLRIFLGKLTRDDVHRGFGLFDADPGPQTAASVDPALGAVVQIIAELRRNDRLHSCGNPNIGDELEQSGSNESARSDSHDCEGMPGDLDGLAYNV